MMATEVNNPSLAFMIFILIALSIPYASTEVCPAPCDKGCPDDMNNTHGHVCALMCNGTNMTATTCYSSHDAGVCYGHLCIRMLNLVHGPMPYIGNWTDSSVEIVWHQAKGVVTGTEANVWYLIAYGTSQAAVDDVDSVNATDYVVHKPEAAERRTVIGGLASNTVYYFKVRMFQVLPNTSPGPESGRSYLWPSKIMQNKTAASSSEPMTTSTPTADQPPEQPSDPQQHPEPGTTQTPAPDPATTPTPELPSDPRPPPATTPTPPTTPTPDPTTTSTPNPATPPTPILTPEPATTLTPTTATPTSKPPMLTVTEDLMPWLLGIVAIIVVSMVFCRVMKVLKLNAQNRPRASLNESGQESVARVNTNGRHGIPITGSAIYHDTIVPGVENEEVPAHIEPNRVMTMHGRSTGRTPFPNIPSATTEESSTDDVDYLTTVNTRAWMPEYPAGRE